MYNSLGRELYWFHMTHDAYTTVDACKICVKKYLRYRRKSLLQVLPLSGPLNFAAVDFLGLLLRTTNEIQRVILVTDRYFKLARAILTVKKKAASVANVLFNYWVIPNGVPAHLLPNNGPRFVRKFLAAICAYLEMKQSTTTTYHLQTNGQVESYNKTFVSGLRHYVAEHQIDWSILVRPLTNAYSLQVLRLTSTTPFRLVSSRHSPGPAILSAKQAH